MTTTAPDVDASDTIRLAPRSGGAGHWAQPPPAPPGRGHGRLGRLARGPAGDPVWVRPALLVLLAGTALLYLWNLGASGYGNSFYAAATQAGSQSWKALLFGSLDAGNAITVDKPPASLWISGLSARVFGFSSWSVLAPQAVEGVAAVGLLYATVRRSAGATAGLLAGTAFALTPVAALMFRFNNPDALLVLLLVAAAYCTVRATERASARWLVLAGTCIGFGFLTKLAQAFLVVPALGLAYLIAAPTGLGRRVLHLAGAAGAIVVSAGWYVALVDLWPASSRPYIGGSTDNSLLQLALGYNGLGRILGSSGGGAGGGAGGGGGGGGMGGGANNGFGGATGIIRLFGSSMGSEISWLLPAALLVLVVGLWRTRRAPRTDPARAALVLWGGWLVVSGLVFSFMNGIIHPYYTVALAPAIAALVAAGGIALWRDRDRFPARSALAVVIALTGIWSFVLLDRVPTWLPALRWIVLVAALALAAALVAGAARFTRVSAVLATAAVLTVGAGSAAYAASTAAHPHTGSIPTSGPSSAATGGGPGGGGGRFGAGSPPTGNPPTGTRPTGTGTGTAGSSAAASTTSGTAGGSTSAPEGVAAGGGGGEQSTNAALTALLARSTTTWAAATTGGATSAAQLELASGQSVIAIGGWDGSDPAPTLAQFQQWVADGKIHYFLAGGGGMGGPIGGDRTSGTGTAIATWVAAHFTATTVGAQTVYDLTATSTNG
ncbi:MULTISPECIES: ArnT family glycosyltransferase [Frankia]|uniref:Uncharacterized protein n=1 Tax=Frankia alni (strain DSM 45986 / CECT 9034 / ACN14a) TaxID=326424 RepID=Q0RIN6_FRAAA|nr:MULTISPECIES: glycosyltransferase family 39 protein [Frankia]CAJ62632.1 conserved hypothetical protein, putative integral membrane protein [Frankia alni ACN14a]